jgi:DNA-directed RNA polymerase specialized sigma24 family protein
LRRFARGLTGNADRADDLVQAACERALARMEQWMPGTRLDSWMFRIVRTIWIDDLRARKEGYTETLLRLPWVTVFEPAADSPPIAPLPALAGERFTFACLNQLSKVTPECIALWAVLRAAPESRL